MHKDLTKKKCAPCGGAEAPMKGGTIHDYLKELEKGWSVVDEHHLEKDYTFPDFHQALIFTNLVGEVAEKEGHHPDIYLSRGKVKVSIWTHKIDGLSENDFILAAKCDQVQEAVEPLHVCF